MILQEQRSLGWQIALYLFLAGAGAGALFFGFVLIYLGIAVGMAGLSAFIGSLLVLVGTLFLLAHLGTGTDIRSMLIARRMVLLPNLASWVLRGAILLVLMVGFGLGYSVPVVFAGSVPPLAIGIISALLSIGVILYTGFLLASSKGTPFWNTPILPILFLFSALSTGIGVISIVAAAVLGASSLAGALHLLGVIDIPLIILELITLTALLENGSRGNEFVRESVGMLTRGPLAMLFWGVLIMLGLIVPLVLEAIGVVTVPALAVVNGVLLLLGGFYLRYLVLRSAVKMLPVPSSGRTITVAGWTQAPR